MCVTNLKPIVLVLLAFQMSACSIFAPKEPQTIERQAYFKHEVKHLGETLGLISAWYTGASRNWKIIEAHNPELNINSIQIGQRIRIPVAILKKQKPLPKTFIPVQVAKSAEGDVILSEELVSTPRNIVYEVNTISGCEHLENSLEGLNRCAQATTQSLEPLLIKTSSPAI